MCTKYEGLDGQIASTRFGSEYYSELSPSYEDLPGWQESTAGARVFKDLPKNAQAYVRRIEEAVEAHIAMISTGPDRHDTIVLTEILEKQE